MENNYVVVGAVARVEVDERACTVAALSELMGVTPFDVEDPLKLGLIIEAQGLNEAHGLLQGSVRAVPGVMGVWPVSVEWEDSEVEGADAIAALESTTAHPGPSDRMEALA